MGLKFVYHSADIDECATGIHICTGLAQCENGIGFFTCICPLGYELDTSLTGCIGKAWDTTFIGKAWDR